MKFIGTDSKQTIKDYLIKATIGAIIYVIISTVIYYFIVLGYVIGEHFGTLPMLLYFFFPLWSPIAYLAGDSFVQWYKRIESN